MGSGVPYLAPSLLFLSFPFLPFFRFLSSVSSLSSVSFTVPISTTTTTTPLLGKSSSPSTYLRISTTITTTTSSTPKIYIYGNLSFKLLHTYILKCDSIRYPPTDLKSQIPFLPSFLPSFLKDSNPRDHHTEPMYARISLLVTTTDNFIRRAQDERCLSGVLIEIRFRTATTLVRHIICPYAHTPIAHGITIGIQTTSYHITSHRLDWNRCTLIPLSSPILAKS